MVKQDSEILKKENDLPLMYKQCDRSWKPE